MKVTEETALKCEQFINDCISELQARHPRFSVDRLPLKKYSDYRNTPPVIKSQLFIEHTAKDFKFIVSLRNQKRSTYFDVAIDYLLGEFRSNQAFDEAKKKDPQVGEILEKAGLLSEMEGVKKDPEKVDAWLAKAKTIVSEALPKTPPVEQVERSEDISGAFQCFIFDLVMHFKNVLITPSKNHKERPRKPDATLLKRQLERCNGNRKQTWEMFWQKKGVPIKTFYSWCPPKKF